MKLDKVQIAAISSLYTTIFWGAFMIPFLYDAGMEMYKRGKQIGAEAVLELWEIEHNVKNGNIKGKEEP